MVKLFGVLALLSFAAAYFFYATWFISVWCFFAALMSAVVYLHFVRRNKRDTANASSAPVSRSTIANQQPEKEAAA